MVLEDEALIAMQIEEALTAAGHAVVGPATRVGDAFDLIYQDEVETAVLDVMVAGEHSYSVADVLRGKGVPFVFITGYDAASAIPERFAGVQVVNKPFDASALAEAVARA